MRRFKNNARNKDKDGVVHLGHKGFQKNARPFREPEQPEDLGSLGQKARGQPRTWVVVKAILLASFPPLGLAPPFLSFPRPVQLSSDFGNVAANFSTTHLIWSVESWRRELSTWWVWRHLQNGSGLVVQNKQSIHEKCFIPSIALCILRSFSIKYVSEILIGFYIFISTWN